MIRSRFTKTFLLVLGSIAFAGAAFWSMQYRRSHQPLQSAIVHDPHKLSIQVEQMAFSPDGRQLALEDNTDSLSVWDLTARRWTFYRKHGAEDKETETPIDARPLLDTFDPKIPGLPPPLPKYPKFTDLDLQVADYSPSLKIISPSGNFVAYYRADNLLIVADARSKRILFSTAASQPASGNREYRDKPCAVCFSPDEKILATAFIHENEHDQRALQIALLSTQNGGNIQHWSWNKFQFQTWMNLGGNIKSVALAFSPDGQRLAVSDNRQVSLWDANNGALLKTMQNDSTYGAPKQLIFFQNRPLLASSGWNNQIQIWNVDTGKLSQVFYGPGYPNLIALSPDESRLAAAGLSKAGPEVLQIWDVSKQ